MFRLYALFIPFIFLVSCTDVKKSQTSNFQESQAAELDAEVSCKVDFDTYSVGNRIKITLTAAGHVTRNLVQTTVINDEALEGSVTWIKEENGQDDVSIFAIEGGEAIFTVEKAGSHSLQFRFPEVENIEATCDFVVESEPIDREFSCSVKPPSMRSGILAEVIVKAEGYNGMLKQTVKGKETPSTELKRQEDDWVRSNGDPNILVVYTPGDYEVHLEKDNGDQTKCDFTVKEASLTCDEGEAAIGANIAFMIDNSGSTADTDCTDRKDLNPDDPDGFHYTCSQDEDDKTNREKAVVEAYKVLKEFAENAVIKDNADSQIAITKFSLDKETDENDEALQRNPREGSKGWFETSADDIKAVEDIMNFTYFPYGNTPYNSAMTAAADVFGTVETESIKNQMAILVTDAEPTDQDPSLAKAKADELKSKGIKVVTVYIQSEADRDKRLSVHKKTLLEWDAKFLKEKDRHYYDQKSYDDFDSYFADIKGLAEEVASKVDPLCEENCKKLIVEGATMEGLTEVLTGIVKTHAIKCQ